MPITVTPFFDPVSMTASYLIEDVASRRVAIVDPVLEIDMKSGRTTTVQADAMLAHLRTHGLTVDWILETHAHADHLSSARYLHDVTGGRVAIGEKIREVQAAFMTLFNLEREFQPDGSQFDHLFQDGEVFHLGETEITARLVPGHTPADMAFFVEDAVFVGDTLFMPDVGTARADFPGGNAAVLYRSLRMLLDLPPQTRLYMCHDYPPAGRAPRWETTVAEQRASNIHVHDGIDEAQFVALRTARDATLDVPMLILPAIQVNVRAGRFPPAEDNGISYLRIPLNALRKR